MIFLWLLLNLIGGLSKYLLYVITIEMVHEIDDELLLTLRRGAHPTGERGRETHA
jgi:hypothetical protein